MRRETAAPQLRAFWKRKPCTAASPPATVTPRAAVPTRNESPRVPLAYEDYRPTLHTVQPVVLHHYPLSQVVILEYHAAAVSIFRSNSAAAGFVFRVRAISIFH